VSRILAPALALVLSGAGVLSCSTAAPPAPAAGSVRLDAPPSAEAGTSYVVRVRPPSGVSEVQLSVVGAYRTVTHRLDIDGETAGFEVAAADNTVAGLVTLVASGPGLEPSSAELSVLPAEASGPLVPLIGPRSIVADGADFTMVSVLPADRFGNPLADGTPLSLRRLRPDGGVEDGELVVDHHVARTRLVAGTVAGEDLVQVALGPVRGRERSFREVAGTARPFELRVDAVAGGRRADGRALTPVTTTTLVDRHGNPLPDGTMVEFRAVGPDGASTMQGVTIGGRATATLEAPGRPGTVDVQAWAAGTASSPLSVTFGAAVSSVPARARVEGDAVVVDIGPVLGPLGGYVPDGTEVTVRAVSSAGGSPGPVTRMLRDGRGRVRLDNRDRVRPSAVVVTVSGEITTVEVN
jgi:hypothetical protein